jgi:hypothetical protein
MSSTQKQKANFYKPIVLKDLFANYVIDKSKFPILNKNEGDEIGAMFDITARFKADKKVNNALCEYLKLNRIEKVLGRHRTIGSSLSFHTDGHALGVNNSLDTSKTFSYDCKGKLNLLARSAQDENYLIFLNYFLGENIEWSKINQGKFYNGSTNGSCKAIKTYLPVENKNLMTGYINKLTRKSYTLNAETYNLILQDFQSMLNYSVNDALLFNPTQYHASGELLTGKNVFRNFVEFFIY